MKTRMFSVKDGKAGHGLPPFTAPNAPVAMRYISNAMAQDPNGDWARHSEDFNLFDLAEFDSETLVVTPNDAPNFVANLKDIKESI